MRGSLYGSKNPVPALVKRINMTNFEVSQILELPDDIYDVISAVIDQQNGVIFLATRSAIPGRIIQISLANPDFM